MRVSAADVARVTGGRVVGDPNARAERWTNDSRRAAPGTAFVAIEGERDGHDYVAAALAAGATIAVVARDPLDEVPDRAALIVVDNPLAALARVAVHARAQLDAEVIGITGSVGKTSTKDLVAAALGTTRRTHAAEASFNNEVGLPITVANAPESVEVVVCEMGARFSGNIAELCAIAQPTLGIVTNVGTAHTEHLGGIRGVLATKAELLASLPSSGCAFIDVDGAHAEDLAAASAAPVVTVGTDPGADVRLLASETDGDLRTTVTITAQGRELVTPLGLRGDHQARNALFAVAVGRHLNIDLARIGEGLARARGSALRMELSTSAVGLRILDDSYNANPASMDAALEALRRLDVPGRRIAVLGDMLELGVDAQAAHRAVGVSAVRAGVEVVVAVGAHAADVADGVAAEVETITVASADDAVAPVLALAGRGDAVLVKASRAVGLERVAAALRGSDEAVIA